MNIANLSRAGEGVAYWLARGTYDAYLGAWYTLTSRYPFGTNVYEEEWDALLVLDACRVDALEAVADEYDFVESVDTRRSVGSHSLEWLAKTFTTEYADEIADTTYLTANTHAQMLFVDRDFPPYNRSVPGWPDWDTVEAAAFDDLEMIWKYGHDDELGNTPPSTVTDRVVEVGRDRDPDQLVAHYMQPHAPYLAKAIDGDTTPTEAERYPLDAFARGDLSRDQVWAGYLDNLRLALDEVELLLANLDAERVVITADHGEAIGEWGDVDHREGFLHPVVKRVPWVETTATDDKTHVPQPAPSTGGVEDADVESHLEDLGYL